jgi:hypothetical protein
MKARRKVVTSPDARPVKPKRTPTVRPIKSAIVPVDRSRVRPSAGPSAPPAPTLAEREALDRIDLSVELAPRRGLRLPNPIMVASGTFGYGVE